MKYDLSVSIPSILGEPLKESDAPGAKEIAYRDAALTALISAQGETPAEKLQLWDLACKIRDSAVSCELQSDDIVLLKKALDKVYGVAVYGPFVRLLEADPEERKLRQVK